MPSTIIVTSWDDDSPAVEAALACGAHGALSKALTAGNLIEVVETVRQRRDRSAAPPAHGTCHPGSSSRLTPREVDVLRLIGGGLTNQEIADRLYVSINSVKSYVRSAYRKICVKRRTQAVAWVQRRGLSQPAPLRIIKRDETVVECRQQPILAGGDTEHSACSNETSGACAEVDEGLWTVRGGNNKQAPVTAPRKDGTCLLLRRSPER